MEYAKVNVHDAERARTLISQLGLFDRSRSVKHSPSYVYFPISISTARAKKLIAKRWVEIVAVKDAKSEPVRNYRDELGSILTTAEMGELTRGYDMLGNIAIIDLSGKLKRKERKIADALMRSHKSVKTVLAKAGAVSGVYRIRKVRYVAGEKNYIAEYRENNCTFRFDVRKTFFSNRLSFERTRIMGLVKDKESVMVMFAGVGPFAIEIAKAHPKTTVRGIELNRNACTYMNGNIKLNKVTNVKAQCGDVKKLAGRNRGFADRIIMPLPNSSIEFLDQVFTVAKRKAVVHLYRIGPTGAVVADTKAMIREHAKRKGYSVRFVFDRVVRPYSSKDVEIVLDFAINR